MSLMQQYAACYGIPLKEVKEWVKDYASGNVPEPVKEWMEPTKEERIESIKAYIQREIDDSLTGRIKYQLAGEKIDKAIPKQVDICPF